MQEEIISIVENNYREKFGEKLHVENATVLGGGCISSALKLESKQGEFFLKWNASGAGDMFLREAESLAELHKSGNEFVVIPKPIMAKAIDETPGYLLCDYLPPASKQFDDERLGRGIARMHQLHNERYGFWHTNYCGSTPQDNSFKTNWIDFYVENRILNLVQQIKQYRSWSGGDEKLCEKFLNRIPTLLDYPTIPSLIHGDLWSGNYMRTAFGPALIDPCASYCDREFEMGIMTMFGGFSARVYDAYSEFYPLEAGWRDRNLIYQLYHVLNHYLLFGGYYKNQALDIMKRYT